MPGVLGRVAARSGTGDGRVGQVQAGETGAQVGHGRGIGSGGPEKDNPAGPGRPRGRVGRLVSFGMSTVVFVSLLVLSVVGTALAGPATPPATAPTTALAATPAVYRDVVYGTAGGVTLKLDAVVPPGDGPFPAVVMVHGGAWQAGNKSHFHALFDTITKAGCAYFSIDYRLAPKYKFPACADDVETAMKWVAAHAAEYHCDPKRIALLGESAGGHLVELVATESTETSGTRPAAVVALYAPSDLKGLADYLSSHGAAIGPTLNSLVGHAILDDTALALIRDASPVTHVHAGLPPFLLLHGTADRLVPYTQSVTFQAALRAVGVPCDLVTVQGGAHGMIFWNDPTYKDKIAAFLQKTLK